jgi:Holliday junction resolvase RusA-like endonuclease
VDGSEAFTFAVLGRAAPQGSKTLVKDARTARAHMREASNNVHPWRTKVRRAALGPDGNPLRQFHGPVQVHIEFEFRRAKSNQDDYPTGMNIGDVDKLTRAVLDALTQSRVIEDDRYVVEVSASKHWGDEDRAVISVSPARDLHMRPIGAAAVIDFAEKIGTPLDPWQRLALDEVVADYGRKPVNPFGPKGPKGPHATCLAISVGCGEDDCPLG